MALLDPEGASVLTIVQESPHEHQQAQLLSRIITNVVRMLIKHPCHELH